MAKRTINARQVAAEIRAGTSDTALMEKYGLSPKGIESLKKKLIEAGVLSPDEISRRSKAPTPVALGSPPKKSPRRSEPSEVPEVDPELAAAAELLKQGAHDSELMRKLDIGPGKLETLKKDLVRLGYIEAPREEGKVSDAAKTKQCASCGREIAESALYCTHCGHDFQQALPETPTGRREQKTERTRSEESFDNKYCEWEDNRSEGTLGAFFQTAGRCLLTPTGFFSSLPLDSGYWSPLLFSVMAGVLGGVLGVLWNHLFRGGDGAFALFQIIILMSLGFVGALILMPLFLFIFGGIVHGLLLLLGGAKNGFQATFRVISYSSVTTLFNAIPIVGAVASLWGTYLAIVGLRETHETSTGKAAGAVLVPVVVPLVLSTLLLGMWWLPWRTEAEAPKIQTELPATYSTEPLSSDQCQVVEEFLQRVESASGGLGQAGPQIKAAMRDLEDGLKAFENDPQTKEVKGMAGSIAALKAMILMMKQMGNSDTGEIENKMEEISEALRARCQK